MLLEKLSIGRIVHYRLSADDANAINRRRIAAEAHMTEHRTNNFGIQVHVGNAVVEGDVFPMIITRVWGADPFSAVNGQVLLDGNDLFWATSRTVGEGPGTFSWPVRS